MATTKDNKRLDYPQPQESDGWKLSQHQRAAIRQRKRRRIALQRLLDRVSDQALALEFGVSKSTIQRIW